SWVWRVTRLASRPQHALGEGNVGLRHGGAMKNKRAASKTSAGRKRRGRGQNAAARRLTGRRWSRHVTKHSDALTLKKGVFTSRDPKRIAASLKRSAEKSRRRKGSPFR